MLGLTKGALQRELVRRCVESLAKLTDADRSGALVLLADNPKVAGSSPPPQIPFSKLLKTERLSAVAGRDTI